MSEQNLEQLLNAGDFSTALKNLARGEKLPKSLPAHQKSQLLDKLFQNQQYQIILHLLKDKTIEGDVYEFDSFDGSVFQSLLRNFKKDEKGFAFFKEFIAAFDNLNDEVAAQTLLGYFFEKLAPVEMIQVLLDAGCDANFKTNSEDGYIHQVVRNNERRFELNDEQLNELKLQYITLLVNEGLDIDAENIVKKTPLIIAIEANKTNLLKALLENGANPNHQDKNGNTAFFYAVSHLQSNQMYDILRDFATPDFSIVNKDGVTILFEYLRMLSVSDSGLSLLKKLITDGADLYQPSTYYGADKTALEIIAEKPADILEIVLESTSVDLNRHDNSGNTLLHHVCAYNVNYEPEKAKELYRKVKLLLEQGADASLSNDKDQTALSLASDDNLKIKTVELLMKHI